MRRIAAVLAAMALGGCEAVPAFAPPPAAVAGPQADVPAAAPAESGAAPAPGAAFRISNLPAEWDGEATAGGLWVALPYLPAFERVLVRNPETGEAVVARLFWRDGAAGEAMLSSAAAEALGLAPGTALIEAEVLE